MTAMPLSEMAHVQLFTCRKSSTCSDLLLFACVIHCINGSHSNTRSLFLMSVEKLGLWVIVILTLVFYFFSTQESTKRLTMKKLPIVVCFHFKVIVMTMRDVLTSPLFKVILPHSTKVPTIGSCFDHVHMI